MTGGGEKATKRPLEGNETQQVSDSSDQKGKLGELLQQIEFFEQLGEEEEPQQPASKKPSKLHSLTQNTTHRKIRCGGRAGRTAVCCPGCLSTPPPPTGLPPSVTIPTACWPCRVGVEFQAVLPPLPSAPAPRK